MDSLENLKLTTNDDGTALLELNRPAKRNAFSQAMIGELAQALNHLDAQVSVRAVVLTGTPGGPFCGMSYCHCSATPLLCRHIEAWVIFCFVWRLTQGLCSGHGPQGAGSDLDCRGSHKKFPQGSYGCVREVLETDYCGSVRVCGELA